MLLLYSILSALFVEIREPKQKNLLFSIADKKDICRLRAKTLSTDVLIHLKYDLAFLDKPQLLLCYLFYVCLGLGIFSQFL